MESTWPQVAGDGGVRVRNTESGAQFSHFEYPNTVPISSVTFSPDDKSTFLAMSGANGKVIVWDWRVGKEYAELRHNGVRKVVFSPDGMVLATAGGTTARLWNYLQGVEVVRMKHESNTEDVAFGNDGKWLVSGGDRDRSC
jgi:WD40 repeat protein